MRPQVEGPQRWPRSTGIQKGPGRVPLQLGMGGIRIGGTTVGDPIVAGCGVGLKIPGGERAGLGMGAEILPGLG